MLLSSLLLAYLGFASLSLAMDRHHRDLFSRTRRKPMAAVLRILGYVMLLSALWPATACFGVTVGIVAWSGILSIAAMLVVLSHVWLLTLVGHKDRQ